MMRFPLNTHLFKQSARFFSNDKSRFPVNIVVGPLVPKSITNTTQFQKKWRKTLFNPIEKDDISLDNHIDTINNPNATFHVGYFDQYPKKSHQNCATFIREFVRTSRWPKKDWRCNTEDIHINITFPIDYYPFTYTYTKSKNKSLWKADKDITLKSLGIESNIEDYVDGNLPILVRKLSKKTKQTLVCWRDCHPDIKIIEMETLIAQYKPDLIIMEYPVTAHALKPYCSLFYRCLLHPYLRLIQRIVPKRVQNSRFGTALGNIIRVVSWSDIPTAYAVNSAIMMSIKNNINICLADYPETFRDAMSHLQDVLDQYQLHVFHNFPVDMSKLAKIQRNDKIPSKLENLLATRLGPHLLSIGDFRNDLMTLAINESVDNDIQKILFIAGAAHWLDIRDKLCGNAEIINPFKEVTKEHVILKPYIPLHYTGHSKLELDTADIAEYIDLFGIDVVALLMIPQKNYKTYKEIEQAMNGWITDWNDSICKFK